MVITFEIQPRDRRMFEAWQLQKSPITMAQLQVLSLGAVVVGVLVWYTHPYAFGLDGDQNFHLIPLAFLTGTSAVIFAINLATQWRHRMAPGLVEGHHSLHFSEWGVHHVSPIGVHRHPWTSFAGVNVTMDYLFLRFREGGTVAIPVSALKAFGPSYDEAFLAELAPLISGANNAEPA